MSINQTKQNWRTELPETIFRKFLCDCYDLLWVLIILLWFGRPSEPDTQMKMTTVDLSIGFCQFSKLKDNIRIMFLDFFDTNRIKMIEFQYIWSEMTILTSSKFLKFFPEYWFSSMEVFLRSIFHQNDFFEILCSSG